MIESQSFKRIKNQLDYTTSLEGMASSSARNSTDNLKGGETVNRNPNAAIQTFIAVIRSLFPQLGLLIPREFRFSGIDGSLGSVAGIYDEHNGIIDIDDVNEIINLVLAK